MSRENLITHLQTGVTHTCRCWQVIRADGRRFGFTDHDRPLTFEGQVFSPQNGLSARALASSAGLSVDNSAALGVLSDAAITEEDIRAGRYDGAAVTVWQVCWDDPAARQVQFRGTLGEITRANGAFEAELHGLTEALNQPLGRSYLKTCSAILGDARCAVALADPAYRLTAQVADPAAGGTFSVVGGAFADGWFTHGLCEVLDGSAAGLRAAIKADDAAGGQRRITLWSPLAIALQQGDQVRLTAGCDKRAETCRSKFANFLNFQGFPDMPGEDWLVSVPRSGGRNTGGSLTR